MNKYLIKLAKHLDKKDLHKEADYVDWIMKFAGKDYSLVKDTKKCKVGDEEDTSIGPALTIEFYSENGKLPKKEFTSSGPVYLYEKFNDAVVVDMQGGAVFDGIKDQLEKEYLQLIRVIYHIDKKPSFL